MNTNDLKLQFIIKANLLHNNKYDYSLVEYKNYNKKVKIICPIHGVFEQTPGCHLNCTGCKLCSREAISKRLIKSTEEFIRDCIKVHGNFYDYSKTIYTGNGNKIIVICPIHGEFECYANNHLKGHKCKKCSCIDAGDKMRMTKAEFLIKAFSIHGNFYDYSLVEMKKSNKDDVKIICPIHGVFEQSISAHINHGQGCPICSNSIPVTYEKFIERSTIKHNGKFDYSLVNRDNFSLNSLIKIICPIHGVFEQRANAHISGNGCKYCGKEVLKKDKEYFIKIWNGIFNNKYDYSLVDKVKRRTKITVICPIHGPFNIRVDQHSSGSGCKKCANESLRLTNDEFIKKCNIKHDNEYDYSKTQYITGKDEVTVTCPTHGDFKLLACYHLGGTGCPFCTMSKGETKIGKYLKRKNIEYERQKKFDGCKNILHLPFDIYFKLNGKDICIEYHGKQHYEPIKHFGGFQSFVKLNKRDNIKEKFCETTPNLNLIIVPYWEYNNIDKYLDKKLKLYLNKCQAI
jgi:hypothetical protein